MAAALAEPPPGFKGDLADPPPGLKLEEEPKALAEPPPGLKLEEPKAIAPPPPGLKIEEPAPALPKKPVTIDPGVDVGFGPGVAPPDLSPVTGRPVSEKAPPTPSTPAPGVDIGFGPGVAPPADWQKQNLIPGVGVAPTEPPKVVKSPVKAAAPVTAPKPVTIDPGVDVGFGPGVAPPETTPEKAAEQAAPGAAEAVKTEVAAKEKADEKAAQLPAAVTAVTYRNDPNAQGEETQAPDETGALQQGKFVYSQKDRAESLVTQTPNKQDLYVRAAKIAADPNIPQAQKEELLNTFAEAATKYATADEPGGLESGLRFAGGAIQTLLHLPELAESLARFGFSTAQAAMVLGKIGTGQEINAQDDAVLHTLLASASEGTASAVELGENIRNWLVKSSTKGTNIKPTDPNMMSWEQINQLPLDQQKEVFLAKARWLGNRYNVAESRQKGELDPFWAEQFRNLTGHEPNTIASLAEQHIYPDTKAIPAGGMVLSPLNILFPAGEGLIGKSLLAERGAGMLTGLTADAMSKLSWIQRKAVEPWAPGAGKIAGGRGAQLAAVTLGMTHLPPPISWLTFGALGKVRKLGEAVGEKIGQSPQWMRENLWDPAQKVVAEQANDIRYGTNNVQANYGPLAPLFMRGAGGMAKGAVIAAPFAAGAETPEEAGSAIAFGAGLGGLHEAGAARDAALSSLFFRDPEKYKSLGYTAKQYGTDYFGQNYDMAHDAWTSGQSQMDQDRINDSRGLLPNVEQYHLGNQDYQDAVAHLQNNGYLPAGNLKSRGFNILTDPATGKALILINGDAPGGFATAAHEIGHTIYRTLSQDTRDAFRNAAFQFNDPDALAQYYVGNLVGRNVRYMDLPSEAEIANGSKQYLPGLDGYTKEHFAEEMGAETVAALLRGQPLSHFIRDPSLFRRTQLALGTVLNKMGINVTPEEATTMLGVRPGVAQMWIMDKALRDYFKKNPAAARPTPAVGGRGGKPVPPGGGGGRQGPVPKQKGRQTAATPKPTGGPAPVPPPPPSVGPKVTGGQKGTNNQPDIGGGATGAPQSAIDDAVQGLVGLKFPKRQAQQMVASASGQTAAELLRNALKNHQAARGRIDVPRAPQESVQAQAPTPAHPLEAHRNLESPALLRRVIDGDPQATQALIERHGANWLQAVEKEAPKAAAEFRRKYPEQAAEQDQRIKAGVEAKPEPQRLETDAERAYREKYGTKAEPKVDLNAPPHDAIATRAYELSQERGGAPGHEQEDWAQAEKELRQRAIDAAKARFHGRAGFMPMAGERAQAFPDEEASGRTFVSPLHGKKQFEIDDRDLTMVPPPKGSGDKTLLEHNWGDYINNPQGTSRLGDVINHPDLFKNYPDLRNVTVEMRPEMSGRGAYKPKDFDHPGSPETIMLQNVNKQTLAHEIQHAVQFRENWPRGDNPARIAKEMLKDPAIEQDLMSLFNAHYPELGPTEFPTQQKYFDYMADRAEQWDQWYRDKIRTMASGAYLLSPGEVEARAVGKRAVSPSGWRIKPEEQVALEHGETKLNVEKEFQRMQQLPMGIKPKTKAAFMPDIQEGAITPERFIEERNKSAHPGFLSPLAPEDLANHRLFTSADGKIGAALSPEGDIQNVYNNSEPRIRGGGTGALVHAIEQGGRTLDCYDGALPNIYRQAGFKETGRMKFNDEFAPKNWDYAQFDRPDVVFMGWDGYPEGGREGTLARATSTDKSRLPNEPSTRYYEGEEWDRAKEDSRVYARRAVAAATSGPGEGQGPEAHPAGEEPSEGPSGGLRGYRLDEGPQPQIPGSKVSFMPDVPEAPKGKAKKPKAPARVDAPPDLRDSLFTPEQRAWLADAQQKAIAGIEQYPESPISGVRYADGQEQFPEKMTKAQVAAFFDSLNSNKLDFRNPEHQKLMSDALTHDVLRRLISNPESLGWYNRVLDGAMQEMGKLEPRILQDPIHNLIMRLAMAITSQNQKVHPNFESAYRAYLHWDRTGKMPTEKAFFGGGTKSDAMVANFQKINDLIDKHGFDKTEEILKTPMSVRQIKEEFDVKVPGEAQGYTSEASIMLGPKIGSFFNNLSKLYHTLTADLWFTRTMNRMAGRMMGFKKGALIGVEEPEVEGFEGEEAPDEVETGKHQLGKLRDLINTGQIENANKTQQKRMLKEIDSLEAYRDNPDDLDREKAMGLSPTIREWAKAQHKVYQKSTGVNKKGEPLGTYGEKTNSNLLSKNIDLNFQNLTDAPRNGTERENFREIMKQVQSNLASLGIDITHADNQAVLWYLEQDLFARAKGRKAGSFSADYLDAAYALRQKYQGKTPDEFGKVPEPEAPPSESKIKKPKAPKKAAAMPDVPEFPRQRQQGPPLRLSPVVLSQPQEEERERQIGIPSGTITPAPPEVRRGLMMPPPQPTRPALSQQPSQQPPSQQPPPSETGDQTGVADFFSKRGDPPITSSDDPRLTTVSVGGQRWQVNREAAPAFQGFLNELAAAGAPIRSDGGWVYRQKVGASGISEHAYGGAIDLNQEGRNEVTPAFQAWISSHPGALAQAENRWHIYGGERFGDLGHFEWGGVPSQQIAGADQETRRRTGSAAAAHIMHEEGSSDVQDGIPEIFGFRQGQDSEYDEMARLRASGDEQGVHRMAAKGFVERAIAAGSQLFNDPAIKAQIMSLAHMRGPGGARDILNAVATGRIDNSGSVDHLDPEAIRMINSMNRAEFMRRIQIARTVYDKAVHGEEYWNRFGKGLADRYAREREFYASLQ